MEIWRYSLVWPNNKLNKWNNCIASFITYNIVYNLLFIFSTFFHRLVSSLFLLHFTLFFPLFFLFFYIIINVWPRRLSRLDRLEVSDENFFYFIFFFLLWRGGREKEERMYKSGPGSFNSFFQRIENWWSDGPVKGSKLSQPRDENCWIDLHTDGETTIFLPLSHSLCF